MSTATVQPRPDTAERLPLHEVPEAVVPPAYGGVAGRGAGRHYGFALVVTTLLWALAWHVNSVATMAGTWWRSETFAHGIVIYPIALWLIFRQRQRLAMTPLAPCYWALFPMVLVAVVALLGQVSGVNAAREFGIVAMLPLIVWCVAGTQFVRAIAFPLAFTLLAVPIGEFMFPVLMEQTADFTVFALRLSGIPVYREGLFFSIPSGNWSVIEACSGLRYLIASVTLGFLFAYLTYRSPWRRALFVLASVIVPIVANWVRAYLIVMIGHLSGMELAVGVDHLIYGWLFFGVVMLLLFWVGSLWREDHVPSHAAGATSQFPTPVGGGGASLILAAIAAAAVSAAPTIYAEHVDAKGEEYRYDASLRVAAPAGWTVADDATLSTFVPHFVNSRARFSEVYLGEQGAVSLFVAFYARQVEGQEMIGHGNDVVLTSNKAWHKTDRRERRVLDNSLGVVETRLRSNLLQFEAWHMYWVGGRWTAHREEVKFWQAIDKLLGRGDATAVVVLHSRAEGAERGQKEALLRAAKPTLEQALLTLGRGGGAPNGRSN